VVEAISVMASSIEDGLGRFGLLSTVRLVVCPQRF
jgi:hypothetical protein